MSWKLLAYAIPLFGGLKTIAALGVRSRCIGSDK